MRKLVILFLLFSPIAHAAYNPWVCPVAATVSAGSGNISTATLFTATATGFYDVRVYMSPASSTALSGATTTLGFTEGGIARTITLPSFSLLTLNIVTPPVITAVFADTGTNVTYAVSSTLGTYNMRVCYRSAVA